MKQATKLDQLSPTALKTLASRGAIAVETVHGLITVGYIFYTSEHYQPWLSKFNSLEYSPLFSGLDAEGLRGCQKRNLDLDPNFKPKKIRFKTKLNPMETKVLKSKIQK